MNREEEKPRAEGGIGFRGTDLAFRTPLPAMQKLTYAAIGYHSNDELTAWPSIDRISGETLQNRKTVMASIESLCASELLWQGRIAGTRNSRFYSMKGGRHFGVQQATMEMLQLSLSSQSAALDWLPYEFIKLAWQLPVRSSSQRLLALTIAAYSRHQTGALVGVARPELVRLSGLSHNTVDRTLASLVKGGQLHIGRVAGACQSFYALTGTMFFDAEGPVDKFSLFTGHPKNGTG